MITLVLFTSLLLLDVAALCFLLGWACCARRMSINGALFQTVSPT
jgi:hypothetical protein